MKKWCAHNFRDIDLGEPGGEAREEERGCMLFEGYFILAMYNEIASTRTLRVCNQKIKDVVRII